MTARQGCLIVIRRFFVFLLLFNLFSVQSAEYRLVGGLQTTPDQAPFLGALLQRNKILQISGVSLPVQVFSDSKNNSFEAPLSHCGYGLAPCADAQGRVCVIARGTNTFAEKVENCSVSGGVAVLIYNYFDSVFLGAVGQEQALPVFALSGTARESLLDHIGEIISYGYGENLQGVDYFCGGSYLGDGWVLTAAHCVIDREVKDLFLSFGSGNFRESNKFFSVKAIYPHTKFTSAGPSLGQDVALLSLTEVPQNVEAIKLADWGDQRNAVDAVATGKIYGRGENKAVAVGSVAGASRMSDKANVAEVQVVTNAECARAMPDEPLESNMLCAGNRAGVGTCFGDSGGPLVWRDGGQNKLLGVISWSVGCGLEDYYDVFSSVATYRDSLLSVMNDAFSDLDGESVESTSRNNDESASQDPLESGGGPVGFIWIVLVFMPISRVGFAVKN